MTSFGQIQPEEKTEKNSHQQKSAALKLGFRIILRGFSSEESNSLKTNLRVIASNLTLLVD